MQDDFTLQAYDYDLPETSIAHEPADSRDRSRLLVLDSSSGARTHLRFHDIVGLFAAGDVLVLNDTRVFPARLSGRKQSGGKAEVFLLTYPIPATDRQARRPDEYFCEVLIKSSRPPRPGTLIHIGEFCRCLVVAPRSRGKWSVRLRLEPPMQLDRLLTEHGAVPLPPYIKRTDGPTAVDRERYQTVYADRPGAVAAPTAGLHFTKELLGQLRRNGVRTARITLHVGYGTFAPVESADIREHRIHQEYIEIPDDTARCVNEAKREGKRIWAVGTTTVRTLEFGTGADSILHPVSGWCDLYIMPGYVFKTVDNLITNFHLPRSSLMFLVAALCGRERLLASYRNAIDRGYRFYSYGDAMAVMTK